MHVAVFQVKSTGSNKYRYVTVALSPAFVQSLAERERIFLLANQEVDDGGVCEIRYRALGALWHRGVAIVKSGAIDVDIAVVPSDDIVVREAGWPMLATMVFSSSGVYWEAGGPFGTEKTEPVHVSYFLAPLKIPRGIA